MPALLRRISLHDSGDRGDTALEAEIRPSIPSIKIGLALSIATITMSAVNGATDRPISALIL